MTKQSGGLRHSAFHSPLILVTAQTGSVSKRTSFGWIGAGLTQQGHGQWVTPPLFVALVICLLTGVTANDYFRNEFMPLRITH